MHFLHSRDTICHVASVLILSRKLFSQMQSDEIPPIPEIPAEYQPLRQPVEPEAEKPSRSAVAKPRFYYIDWLRFYLTAVVVCFHVALAIVSGWTPLFADYSPRDETTKLLQRMFSNFYQSFFMGLFFFISGYFVPSSYRRKGPLQFLQDRTLRLAVPIIVYEVVFGALLYIFAAKVYSKSDSDFFALYRAYFVRYRGPNNHLWFVLLLFLFDLASILVRVCIPYIDRKLKQKQETSTEKYSTKQMLLYTLGGIFVIGFVTFILRIPFRVGVWLPVLGQMAYIGQYVLAYALGKTAYLANALPKLPAKFCLI